MTLYADIMNIAVPDNVRAELEGAPKGFYLLGHRDARQVAAELAVATDKEMTQLRADAAAMRDLLNRAQTAVCVANRTLMLDDMPGQIAELLHRTAYLKA